MWVVQRPQAVEVSRLGGEGEQEGKARLGAYWVAEGPVEVEGEAARRLSALVLDPEAYVWDRDAERVFEAGVWVRFRTASQAVDVVVARDFEQVQVRAPGLEAGTAAQVVVLEVVSERWREELAGLAGLAGLAALAE